MNRDELLQSLRDAGTSQDVLAAMTAVSRERFVPAEMASQAWNDSALRLADGSTISQPAMVAVVLEELRLEAGLRVLEIGSGSGYLLALLNAMGAEAIGIEIDRHLAASSLRALGRDAMVLVGDAATVDRRPPYDRIVFSAALKAIPDWPLCDLTPEGFLLAPVGDDVQELVRAHADGRRERTGRLCRFVPFQ
ncbi:MAG: protein-L-isoaspartate O-methyltransferase [Armatimonadota bacterium]|nr:protein-L-isoaspartate O-methyltransferase [Armatimonadota bacterium]